MYLPPPPLWGWLFENEAVKFAVWGTVLKTAYSASFETSAEESSLSLTNLFGVRRGDNIIPYWMSAMRWIVGTPYYELWFLWR